MEQLQLTRPATPLIRSIGYWIATALIVFETGLGAEWDLARIQLVRDVLNHLGYPLYLLTIIGLWKVPAAIVLIIPRFPRAKEWAYIGIFLVYTTATASHLIVGDRSEPWSPFILACLTIASWALRPADRRWTPQPKPARASFRAIWWILTALLAFCIITGGAFQLSGAKQSVDGMIKLGYPGYFTYLLGFWKVLGAIVILLPGNQRVKEWAYAGIVFDLSGAAFSNIANGMAIFHLISNVVLLAFAFLSWGLRPDNPWRTARTRRPD